MLRSEVEAQALPPVPLDLVLILVNQFVDSSVNFLNRFVRECDERISIIATRIDALEMQVTMLEAKIVVHESEAEEETSLVEEDTRSASEQEQIPPPITTTTLEDPIAQKYLSMARMGIPRAAILAKMKSTEGHLDMYAKLFQ